MALALLIRHFATDDDLLQIYTPNDAAVPIIPPLSSALADFRNELLSFTKMHGIKHVLYSSNSRGIESYELLFHGLDGNQGTSQADARLNNIAQPEWAFKTNDAVKTLPQYRLWHTDPLKVKFVGGESLSDVATRIKCLLNDIQGTPVVVISHTTPLQVFLCLRLGMTLDRIWRFKFDHMKFTVIKDDILLRLNSDRIKDINLSELRV